MRAGPLSNAKIIARLNREFVSSWILRKDLMRLAKADSELGKFAAKVLGHYSYPVDSLVFSAKGEFAGHLPANDAGSLSARRYGALLDSVKRTRK